jgi:uncharacterized membrane protein
VKFVADFQSLAYYTKPSMEHSASYQMGFAVGIVIVTFVFSVVMSFKTRRKLWIIIACITGVPFALLIILFMGVLVVGLIRGFSRAAHGDNLPHAFPEVYRVCAGGL